MSHQQPAEINFNGGTFCLTLSHYQHELLAECILWGLFYTKIPKKSIKSE